MFLHFSIIMIIFKKRGTKFDQKSYDSLFNSIENNLRELGFGDVSVNTKMKNLNKILYDILLKLEDTKIKEFRINKSIILKYFKDVKLENYPIFEAYLVDFYNFCFELPLDSMIREAIKFKN